MSTLPLLIPTTHLPTQPYITLLVCKSQSPSHLKISKYHLTAPLFSRIFPVAHLPALLPNLYQPAHLTLPSLLYQILREMICLVACMNRAAVLQFYACSVSEVL